jgi:hypothetical protein
MAQKIESVFSRIMNGNFSHGTSYWEAIPGHPNSEIHVEIEGDVSGAGPPNPASPRYLLHAKDWFKHLIQYKDLAVYPSRLGFDDVVLTPVSIGEFHLLVNDFDKYSLGARPFAVYHRDTASWVFLESGVLINIWNDDGPKGIYRLNSVIEEGQNSKKAVIAPVDPDIEYSITDSDLLMAYTYASSYGNSFKVQYDPAEAAKVPGFTGFTPGEYLVSDEFGGIITSVQPATGIIWVFVNSSIGQRLPAVTSETNPDDAFTPMTNWRIIEEIRGSFSREVSAVLYDLTLVFTTIFIGDFDEASPRIFFYDEVIETLQHGAIGPVKIDGNNTFFKKLVDPGIERWFYRFLQEVPEPYEGQAELWMKALDTKTVRMGDVALYRGNYTQRMKEEDDSATEDVIDFLESPINVESGVIPKGVVWAYAGGSVCPPGYEQVKGLGNINSGSLLNADDLRISLGTNWLTTSPQLSYRYGQDKPRTIIGINGLANRPVIGPPAAYQVSTRIVSVDPWRYGTGHHLYSKFITFRAHNGDPEPEWVREEFLRIDIIPGYILEFYFATEKKSVYALITQVVAGQFAKKLVETWTGSITAKGEPSWDWEEAMDNPSSDEGDDLRRAWRQVYGGSPKNPVFRGYGIYGQLVPEYEPIGALEILGDFALFATIAFQKGAELRVWKSGVIAHAQRVQELGLETPFGGYGYLGEPHTHVSEESQDIITYGDVGHGSTTDPLTGPLKIPTEHTHGGLFGAVSIPKIRPVILCQKK